LLLHQIHAYIMQIQKEMKIAMVALVTASQMASASAASFFCRLRRAAPRPHSAHAVGGHAATREAAMAAFGKSWRRE
jgi:hypothetical protein